jgi:hypothetical protein
MAKILKNTTASPIVLADCGLTLPASSSYTSTPGEWYTLSTSTQIDPYITAGTIVVNDGHDDLKPQNGLWHIHEESLSRDTAYTGTASIQATINGTITLDASSRLIWVFTGTTAGQILKLGDARTYNIGQKYEMWNVSNQLIQLNDGAGNPIFICSAFQKTWATLQDNSTQAGIWLIEANFMGNGGGGNGCVNFGYNGTANQNRWLEVISNNPTNLSPFVVAGYKTIRAFSMACQGNATGTVTLFKNGAAIGSISLSNTYKGTLLNLNLILVDGDELSAQVTLGTFSRPNFVVWF